MRLSSHRLWLEDHEIEIHCRHYGDRLEVQAGETSMDLSLQSEDEVLLCLRSGDETMSGVVLSTPEHMVVSFRGRTWSFNRRARPVLSAPDPKEKFGPMPSPMTGTVVELACSVGDEVAPGDLLIVIEAMKMEHRLVAPGPARIREVNTEAGARVNIGDVLVELDPVDSETP